MQSRNDVRSAETGDAIIVLHCPGTRHDDDASDSAGDFAIGPAHACPEPSLRSRRGTGNALQRDMARPCPSANTTLGASAAVLRATWALEKLGP